MEEEKIIDMMERIHDYIHGWLSNKGEVVLWIEFLKDPHWYYIFETELLYTHFAKNAEKDFQSYFSLVG